MSVAPGWHRDPADPTTQRWWDGEGWVGDPLPADREPPPGPPRDAVPPDPAAAPAPAFSPAPGTPPGGPAPSGPGASAPSGPGASAPSGPGATLGPAAAGPWSGSPGGATPANGQPPAPYPFRPFGYAVPEQPKPYGYPLASLGARLTARLVDIGLVLALNVLVNGWFAYQYWLEIYPVLEEAWRRAAAGESMDGLPQVSDQASSLLLVVFILAAALWFAYEVPAVANTGQTPGKRLLRIRVLRLPDPRPPTGPPASPDSPDSPDSGGGRAGAPAPEQAIPPTGPPPPLGFGRSIRRWNTMGLPTLLWWCFGIGFLLQLVDALFVLFDRPLRQALHDKSAFTVVVATGAASADEPEESPS